MERLTQSRKILNCTKNLKEAEALLDKIASRTSLDSQEQALAAVNKILEEVKELGDDALIRLTTKFDGFTPKQLEISPAEISQAWNETPKELQDSLFLAKNRIEEFHKNQFPKDFLTKGVHGEHLGRRWSPVSKAGIYIPGGRAAYPSTVLMNAIPALVAGVEEVIMMSPADQTGKLNKTVLAAAHVSGITKIFRIGGAQAIGALAYGTETIPRVDVISGPGNIYVTLAKKSVYGQVGIDSLAGPSEVLIIADNTAKVEQLAADLLAQAEHDPLAASILLTTDETLVEKVNFEIEKQLQNHPRAEICKQSIKDWGLIVICKNLETCAILSNRFAPEHLELLITNPSELASKIKNAGAIFLGHWSPEAAGDYLAGPNHTLPTSGTARFSSALGVETFMKSTSIINFTEEALIKTGSAIIQLANSEGLHSHANSIKLRIPRTSLND